eukprot:UN24223
MSSRDPQTQTSSSTEGFSDENTKVFSSFDDMHLDMMLLKGIYGYGWENPTTIQQRVVVPMKDGRDIVAQAQSGKGKTGAFTVASLAIIDCEKRFPQVVILSPTRELSDQTYVVTRKLGANLKGLSVAECVGGSPVRECIRILRTGPQIVIGTPGRMRHMLESGELNL